MDQVSLGEIHYNPVTSAYEARVDVGREGRTYAYPCSVPGTLMMKDADVRVGLKRQALHMATRKDGLMSVR